MNTIEDALPRKTVIADGSLTEVTLDFPLFSKDFMLVYLNDTKTEDFSVDLTENKVILGSAPEQGTVINVVRVLPISYTTILKDRGAMSPANWDNLMVELVAKMQTLKEAISRTIQLPIYTNSTGEAYAEEFFNAFNKAMDALSESEKNLEMIETSVVEGQKAINNAVNQGKTEIAESANIVNGYVDEAKVSAEEAAQAAQEAKEAAGSISADNLVNLTDAQTIDGLKTFVGTVEGTDANALFLKSLATDLSVLPESDKISGVFFFDKTGTPIGETSFTHHTDGSSSMRLMISNGSSASTIILKQGLGDGNTSLLIPNPSVDSNDNTAATTKWLNDKLNSFSSLPVGAILSYPADTPPKGFLVCDGSAVSREDYADLFNLIGTKYGDGPAAYGWSGEDARYAKLWTKYDPIIAVDVYSDSDCTTRIGSMLKFGSLYQFTPSNNPMPMTVNRNESLDVAGFKLPNFVNRTFWGGTSSGTYIEAGLPNITGTVRPADVANKSYPTAMNSPNGAFHALQETTTGLYSINSGESKYLNGLGIDASLSSKIYGRSETVQPAALQTLIIIKY